MNGMSTPAMMGKIRYVRFRYMLNVDPGVNSGSGEMGMELFRFNWIYGGRRGVVDGVRLVKLSSGISR